MRSTLFLTGLTLALMSGASLAEEKRELGSHEHGAATLQVAIEGSMVEMAIAIPGESIVGFEHAAETDEQKAAVTAETERLGKPMDLFTLPEAAGCEVASAEVELHQEGDHNEFEAEYALTCADTGAVTTIQTKLFEMYPELEEIEVEYATPGGQGAAELEADSPALTLPSTS